MNTLPSPIPEAIEFEKSVWSNGSVSDDSFYAVPEDAAKAPPGTLLKVEKDADTKPHCLSPLPCPVL